MYIHKQKNINQKFSLIVGLLLSANLTYAEESFFTIVDSQGNPLHVVVDKKHIQTTTNVAALNKQEVSDVSSAVMTSENSSITNVISNTSLQEDNKVLEQKSTDLYLFNNSAYIDSDELKKKAFNKDDRIKFFAIPNNFGGIDQVEKRAGVVTSVENSTIAPVIALEVSTMYKVLNKDTLASLLPKQCVPKKQLQKLKKLENNSSVNLWIKKQKRIKKDFYEIPVTLVQLTDRMKYIQLTSYSNSNNTPRYYWPLAVFLDRKGCTISAVEDFYQGDIRATWLQKPAIFGNLLAPEKSAYLLLTPLAESSNIDKKLTNTGSIQLSTGSSNGFNFK